MSLQPDQIETEYGSEFPIRRNFPFGGNPHPTPYHQARSEELRNILVAANNLLNGTTVLPDRKLFGKLLWDAGRAVINAERVYKMHNYELFYEFVWRLIINEQKLREFANTAPKIWDLINVYDMLLKKLKVHLRITPMGPEPNQVNAMCHTQFDKAGRPQFDQCTNVYSMCRNKRDKFGQLDDLADLKCTRYIKKRVFPQDTQAEPDAKNIFATYDYAYEGDAFLKRQPSLIQHPWVDVEYDPYGALKQWDNKYWMPTTAGAMGNWKVGDPIPAEGWTFENQSGGLGEDARGWRAPSREAGQQGMADALVRKEKNAAAALMALQSSAAAQATYENQLAAQAREALAKQARMANWRPDASHEDEYSIASRAAKARKVVVPARGTPRRR